jgi:O-methyltransferase
MSHLKSALKAALLPIRTAGATFFRPFHDETVVWKAAQICFSELVAGDYLEFGVFRGDSFIQAFKTIRHVYGWYEANTGHSSQQRGKAREIRDRMRFFAFDSFRGLPAPKGLDRHSRDFTEGQFACSANAFLNRLKRNAVDLGKVVAIPGWFEDTCTEETIKKYHMNAASIVHIDCDLYESTKIVLKFIEPLLVDGTVLIFDDWFCFRGNPDLGEQCAFNEWVQGISEWRFTEYQKEGAWRNSFIANRRGSYEQRIAQRQEAAL